MKVENAILYFSREPGTVTGVSASRISSSVALILLNLDIRLISLTWGYLLCQEIKAHVSIFKIHNTVVVCFKHLTNKSEYEKQRALLIITFADSLGHG